MFLYFIYYINFSDNNNNQLLFINNFVTLLRGTKIVFSFPQSPTPPPPPPPPPSPTSSLSFSLLYHITDVNECLTKPCKCAQPQNCKATCTDTMGSFTCSCNAGFRLAADKKTCEG